MTKHTDEEFASTWAQMRGHVASIAKALDHTERWVYRKRKSVEKRLGVILPSGNDSTNRANIQLPKRGHRLVFDLANCTIPVFSDAHFWPDDPPSTSYLALLALIEEFKPPLVINNGDAFDGARCSSHPPTGWANMPSVAEELATCQDRLGEIVATARRANPDAIMAWDMGNHDSRFSTRLASVSPEYVKVRGTDLKDHFPDWNFAWSSEINGHVMIKHRWHGGMHAAFNNTMKSGWSMVTSHLHRLCITPFADYDGRRWGVDTGTLAEFGPEFDKFTYGEDNPFNWCEGLAVLSFDEYGCLLPPELVEVLGGKAYFRGQVIATKPEPMRMAA
jgi:hypothetical protein